jgi:hypothetical protein
MEWTPDEAGMDEWTADEARMGKAAVERHTAMRALRGGRAGQEAEQASTCVYMRQVHNAPRVIKLGTFLTSARGLLTCGTLVPGGAFYLGRAPRPISRSVPESLDATAS